jgi:hypothetical protein
MDFARPASSDPEAPREPDAGGSAVGVTEADVDARIAAAVAEAEAKAQADLQRQKEESDAAMAKMMANMAQLKAAGGGGAAAAVPAPAPGSAPAPAPPAPPADPRYADKEFQGKSCARRSSGMRLVIKPNKLCYADMKLDVEASDTIEQVKQKIYDDYHIPLDQQKLVFQEVREGKRVGQASWLKNHRTLTDYHIKEDDVVHLVVWEDQSE